MKYRVFFLILLIILPSITIFTTEGKKITSKVKAPKETTSERLENNRIKSSQGKIFKEVADSLNFVGYDKKGSADYETFFVDNSSSQDIMDVEVEISYFSNGDKLIHKRRQVVQGYFPHKESRKIDIPTWDRQKSYHYIRSVPSKKGSTPYTVSIKVLSFIRP